MSRKFLISQAVFLLAAVAMGFLYWQKTRPPALPVYGKIADFQLQNQDGKAVTLSDLKGKVWVADFMFTTCAELCPMMSRHMARLNQIFGNFENVRLVSISVNPENDTPSALKTYAQKYGADEKQWMFLTGPRDDIQKLAVESFKLGDMKEIAFHSPMFVLVDRKAQVRGYYDSTDEAKRERLVKDLNRLLGRK